VNNAVTLPGQQRWITQTPSRGKQQSEHVQHSRSSYSRNHEQLANFIWSVADLLRGPYRPPQYERVMLPLTVLRRFDAVLAPSKEAVLKRYEELKAKNIPNIDAILNNLAKDENGTPLGFHNHSQLDFPKLKGDPDNIGRHLADYIAGFSENIRKIFERFEFDKEIEKLEESNRLYQVVSQFAEIDLHPRKVDNITMGLVFEDLIRRFNEAANETAGDHFTPREVIQLMVNLLLEPDTSVLTQAGVIVTICDPACGTGGMLAEAQNWIRAHNEQATVKVFGQDYNPRSYAVAASDLLIKGHKDSQVVLGNTLTDDPFPDQRFDYLLANPPFGVDWKAEKKIDRWPNFRGYSGKLPRINDGALLFLLYMMSKFQDYKARRPRQARLAHRHRLQRLAAVHRRRRQRRERNPPLDHRARLARSHRRPARADVLQHRHRHLHLGGHQPQGRKPQRARSSSSTPASATRR
jgi:type I restriction enzyme M protein